MRPSRLIALFFTRIYNRLLRPGLAAALPALRAITTPLKRAFDTLGRLNRHHDQPRPTCSTKLDAFAPSLDPQAGLAS